MAYIGNDLQVAYQTYKNIDDISGSFNGSTTSFALLVGGVAPVPLPLNSQQCLISVGGVIQRPDDTGAEGFRLSGGNIVFSSAPGTGEDFFGVILAGADYVNVGANFPSGSAAVPSITFDSDLDTGIYNSGANQVSVTTSGTERFRVDSSGQIEAVSLGTAAAPTWSFTTDPNTGIYSPGADQVAISTNGSQRVTVNSSGNVGIGVASPAARLDVRGSGPYMYIVDSGANSAAFVAEATNSVVNVGSTYLGTSAVPLALVTGGTERARIDTSGRLLVGTSSSAGSQRLVVQNGVNTTFTNLPSSVVLENTGAIAAGLGTGITFSANYDGTNQTTYAGISGIRENATSGSPAGALVFGTRDSAGSASMERMRIDSSGQTTITTTGGLGLYVNNTTNLSGYNGILTTVQQNGNNTSTYHFRGNTNAVNNWYLYGNGTTSYSSDQRLKKNIETTRYGYLSDILQLRVVKYNWKNQEDGAPKELGLIAQEVEKVFPGLIQDDLSPVSDEDPTIYKQLKGSVLPVILLKALQEAAEKIEALEAKVAALEAA